MRFCHFNLILKVNRTVTFYCNHLHKTHKPKNPYLCITLSNLKLLAHIHIPREDLILLRVNHGEGVDRNQYLVAFAVDADAVVVVFVLIIGCELHVQVLAYTCWDHSLLVVLDLEVRSVGRQDVQTLRRWGIVDESDFDGVRLLGFEASELDY
jgi:hypothetical protein